MLTTLRTRIARTVVAAATVVSLAAAGGAALSAHPVAAAPQDYLFKADVVMTPAFKLPAPGGGVNYYFALRNTGIGGGTLLKSSYDCGYKDQWGEIWASGSQQQTVGPVYVPQDQTRYVMAHCGPASHSTNTGARIFGHFQDNLMPYEEVVFGTAI